MTFKEFTTRFVGGITVGALSVLVAYRATIALNKNTQECSDTNMVNKATTDPEMDVEKFIKLTNRLQEMCMRYGARSITTTIEDDDYYANCSWLADVFDELSRTCLGESIVYDIGEWMDAIYRFTTLPAMVVQRIFYEFVKAVKDDSIREILTKKVFGWTPPAEELCEPTLGYVDCFAEFQNAYSDVIWGNYNNENP